MTIPDFQTLMRPILSLHADGVHLDRPTLRHKLAEMFELSDDELTEMLPSGRQRRFDNRVGWSITHLAQAGLVERPRRGVTALTARGHQVLGDHPARVDTTVLEAFDEYRDFRARRSDDTTADDRPDSAESLSGRVSLPSDSAESLPQVRGGSATPHEVIEDEFARLRDTLAAELLDRLVTVPPEDFEQIVVDVLVAMGYGGDRRDAGQRIGRSGDGGIDGMIREDTLGLDVIYVQAKRYALDRTVNRPDVQAFVGALHGAHANKGVFLTTARFSQGAEEYAGAVSSRVILIDGWRLAHLMIAHDVGVSTAQRYELKRLDEDYFLDGS